MKDYTKTMPKHIEKHIGENDLFLEIFEGENRKDEDRKFPPLLFVHGAFSGSWMWSKYIPHFVKKGYTCYGMNMRSHYKSRVMDLTKISFNDYLEDIQAAIKECSEAPILIGHSMGGLLIQKLAETEKISGLVMVDTSISKEVNEIAPYPETAEITTGIILPAPDRKPSSIDESEEDVAFQVKYLTMESSRAILDFAHSYGAKDGISINNSLIQCPCLVIKAVNSDDDDRRGRATAAHLDADYTGLWNTTHTGLLAGQRYFEAVESIIKWLERI